MKEGYSHAQKHPPWTWSRLGLLATLGLLWLGSFRVQAQVIYWPVNSADLLKQRSYRIQCINNLKQISVSLRVWEVYHPFDLMATSLMQVGTEPDPQSDNYFGDAPSILYCPADVRPRAPTNWLQVDWSKIDYTMSSNTVGWDYETNAGAWCRIHTDYLQKDWYLTTGGSERAGWPAVIAGPLGQSAVPGSQVRFDVKIAPNALALVSYHWWRGPPYLTDATFYANTNYPAGGRWVTNLVANLGVNNLLGATNSFLIISNAQTNDSDFYCVAVSNAMGTTISYARLDVDSAVVAMATNAAISEANCLNNLKQIVLFANLWALDHGDVKPQSLAVMTNSYGSPMFGWPVLLYCRSDTSRTVPPDWPGVDFANTSYEIVPGDQNDPNAIFCRCKVHRNYAQMDGQVISRPQIRGIQRQASVTQLNLQIFAGRTNVLEASTNLLSWASLASYPSTNGIQVFYETNGVSPRFYRLRLP